MIFFKRLYRLQKILSHPILVKKKENLLYLTGHSFMHGFLLVKPIKNKKINHGEVIFLGDGLEKVEGIKFDRIKNIALYLDKARQLDLEDEFTFAEYNYIRAKCRGGYWPPDSRRPVTAATKTDRLKIRHVKSPVDYQRQVKDVQEIVLVKKSMQIVEKVFGLVRREIKKPGMTEIKLANFIRSAGLKLGAEDVSFPPIVACGANAAVPHHVPSNKKLKAEESIILDFGFKYRNYCSDFTRTVFLKTVPKRLEIAYNQVERAYNQSIEYLDGHHLGQPQMVPIKGITAGDVYQKSVDVLKEKNLDKYFIHSLGHGTGLEIHELPNLSPKSKDILKDGMVFSIEPGAYFPRLGGIRIEDLIYLEKGKVKKFINVATVLSNNIIN